MYTRELTLIAAALAGCTSALWTTEGSPCSRYCGNSLSSTGTSDMVCQAGDVGATSVGSVWKGCIECQLKSTYTHPNGQSDLQWLLYNLRYTLSYCMFSVPKAITPSDAYGGPCKTSTGCGQLQNAIGFRNLTTATGALDFCSLWVEDQMAKCSPCLLRGDEPNPKYWGNYVTILEAACLQKPKLGALISIDGTPFSTIPMTITVPVETPLNTYVPDTSAISLGAKVGIAAAGIVALLFLSGCLIVCLGKRRRRRFLRRLEAKHRHQGWPTPNQQQGETPMSQKPLRGWEDSPISAHTEHGPEQSFPRYFSPYSSQYNSPVSAVDNGAGPSMTGAAWPSVHAGGFQPGAFPNSTQEKLQQMMHEQALANPSPIGAGAASVHTFGAPSQPMEIGLAFGGDDPSIRTKPSNQSMQSQHSQSAYTWEAPGKGKGMREEEMGYELHDVDSNGSVIARQQQQYGQAPVLGHPGYGRRYSPPQTREG